MKKGLAKLGILMKRNSPSLLTGIGVAGLITTTVLAVKATPKALWILEKEAYEKGDSLTKKEIVKHTYKCYIPAAAMGVITTAAIVSANSINLRRNAAIASAYTIAKEGFKEYKGKVIEAIGEKKEQMIRDEVAQEQLNKNPVENNNVILTGKGDVLCYDVMSGRYFRNDIEQIRKVVNDLNHQLLSDMWLTLNEFYYAIGLGGINLGEEVGWNADELIEINFSSKITPDGEPCLVLNYETTPYYDFRNYSHA